MGHHQVGCYACTTRIQARGKTNVAQTPALRAFHFRFRDGAILELDPYLLLELPREVASGGELEASFRLGVMFAPAWAKP